ncbi:MAG: hypothetical protein RSE13_17585 [Planktothrix sp. GU0601_MAG3]|nr:MAG: hypothetical protein RSE13_17585 [Planktothrix sp. GU0601_MAG3]
MINELSFIGQAENIYDEADNLMSVLFGIIEALDHIYKGITIRIHSNFYACKISENLTVQQWLLNKIKLDPKNNKVKIFLDKTRKGPFIDKEMSKNLGEYNKFFKCFFIQQELNKKRIDISESSLAGFVYFHQSENNNIIKIDKIISLPTQKPNFSSEYIEVIFTTDGKYKSIKIHNLTTISQAQKLRLKYDPSPKHRQQGEIGIKGTLMDLSDIEAQEVLDESYINDWFEGKKYYGYKNGNFYEFQPDNVGGYHGYPVKSDKVPSRVLKKMKLQTID